VNPSTDLARTVLDELVHQGVREVVLAPGSRSAPLAFEALRLARSGRLRLHVRLDERSAGFLALGLAKVSGAPVAVVCTSGTAVANLAPAVVEASYSAVPLIALTADRPVESRGVGAPQTIDQVDFFGRMVRFFADLGAARRVGSDDPEGPARAARASVGMAVAAAFGAMTGVAAAAARPGRALGHAGPVHLNVGFRLPLVPESVAAPGGPVRGAPPPAGIVREASRPVRGGTQIEPARPVQGAPWPDGIVPDVSQPARGDTPIEPAQETRTPEVSHPAPISPPRPRRPPLPGCDVRELGEVLGEVPATGVLLVGDLPCSSLLGHHLWLMELATACGWPIVAEPSANLHAAPNALRHAVLVLGDDVFLAAHEPDLVLSVGLFGLSRPTMELLRRARRHVAIELPMIGREVCDPLRTALQVLTAIPLPPSSPAPDPAWLDSWQAADAVAATVVAQALAGEPGLTGAAVAAEVFARAPADGLLLVAASWPVRQVEAYAGRRAGLRVIGNRGANGIDGLVSTTWGAALAHQAADGGPAIALMGDLAFLHDHNGLLVGSDEPRPDLTIVVADNDGGGIFHQLEQGRPAYAGEFERLFGTPLGRDLVAIARAAGVPAQRVTSLAALVDALGVARAAGGVQVIVADVPDRAGEAVLMERIRVEVSARLAAGRG
jgi:2-succinyl-5-enolpyruvyl-6-hydroxy-3-cyclohexene-1-carboxylate synthase